MVKPQGGNRVVLDSHRLCLNALDPKLIKQELGTPWDACFMEQLKLGHLAHEGRRAACLQRTQRLLGQPVLLQRSVQAGAEPLQVPQHVAETAEAQRAL